MREICAAANNFGREKAEVRMEKTVVPIIPIII